MSNVASVLEILVIEQFAKLYQLCHSLEIISGCIVFIFGVSINDIKKNVCLISDSRIRILSNTGLTAR